jgi:cytoskeletal protein CcmA (bactofilin family)
VIDDVSFNSALDVIGVTKLHGFLDVSNSAHIKEQLTVAGRLTVVDDVSFNSTLDVIDTTTLHGFLDVSNSAHIKEQLMVDGRLTVVDDVSFNSTLDVIDATTLHGFLDVSNSAHIKEQLTVDGSLTVFDDISFNSMLDVLGETKLHGFLDVSNSAQIKEQLTVDRDVSFNSTLDVIGATKLHGFLDVSNSAHIKEQLTVDQDVSFNSSLDVIGATKLHGFFDVSNSAHIKEQLTVDHDVSFNSSLDVIGATKLHGFFAVSNSAHIKEQLTVDRDVSFNSTLDVIGATKLHGFLDVSNSAHIKEQLTVDRDVSFNSTLDVIGATKLHGLLDVSNSAHIKEQLTVDGRLVVLDDVSINSALDVTGTTTLHGFMDVSNNANIKEQLTVGGRIVVGNDASFNSNVLIADDAILYSNLDVHGNTLLKGSLTVDGNLNFRGDLSKTDISHNVMISDQLSIDNVADNEVALIVQQSENTYTASIAQFKSDGIAKVEITNNGDISMNSVLKIMNNTMSNNNDNGTAGALYVKGGTRLDGSLNVMGDTYFDGAITFVGEVTSLAENKNAKLSVTSGDITNNEFTYDGVLMGADKSSKFNINGGANFNDSISVSNIIYGNKMRLSGDVSFNNNLLVSGDTSLNSQLFVNGDISGNSTLSVGGDTSLNSQLFVNGDISGNSTLNVGGDTTLNSKLFVNGDISGNSNLYVGGDASLNSQLFVNGDISGNSTLSVGGDTLLNSNAFISSNLYLNGDASLNNNLFVSGVTTLGVVNDNGVPLYVDGSGAMRIPVGTSIERPSNLEIGYIRYNTDDKSFEGYGANDVWGSLGGVSNPSKTTQVYVSENDDIVFKTGGIIRQTIDNSTGDALMNSKLVVSGDISGNSNLSVGGDASFGSNTFISSNLYLNGDASLNNNLFVSGVTTLGEPNNNGVPLYADGSGAVRIPVGTSIERPANLETGYIRYNTDDNSFEGYGSNNAWGSLGGVSNPARTSQVYVGGNGDIVFKTDDIIRQTIDNSTGDVSLNSNLYVGGDASFNGTVSAPTFTGDINGTVTQASQPNITDIGTLTYLDMTSSGVVTDGVHTGGQISLWGSSDHHTIQMVAAQTYGGLSSHTMVFKMNVSGSQGFLWKNSGHTDNASGAMALTTTGLLTVASNTRIGYGIHDTTTPGLYMLDVGGDVNIAGTVSGITKSMVGLSNVDNTSDSDKIVSIAQQTALNLKANLTLVNSNTTLITDNSNNIGIIQTFLDMDNFEPFDVYDNVIYHHSGGLIKYLNADGTPNGDGTFLWDAYQANGSQPISAYITTEVYTGVKFHFEMQLYPVESRSDIITILNLPVNPNPGEVYTIGLAKSISKRVVKLVTDVTDLTNTKANLASPTFTGTVTAPTAPANDDSSTVATTAYVKQGLASRDEYLFLGITKYWAHSANSIQILSNDDPEDLIFQAGWRLFKYWEDSGQAIVTILASPDNDPTNIQSYDIYFEPHSATRKILYMTPLMVLDNADSFSVFNKPYGLQQEIDIRQLRTDLDLFTDELLFLGLRRNGNGHPNASFRVEVADGGTETQQQGYNFYKHWLDSGRTTISIQAYTDADPTVITSHEIYFTDENDNTKFFHTTPFLSIEHGLKFNVFNKPYGIQRTMDIATLQTYTTDLSNNIASHTSDITSLETAVDNNTNGVTFNTILINTNTNNITDLQSDKADLASPTFTGTVTVNGDVNIAGALSGVTTIGTLSSLTFADVYSANKIILRDSDPTYGIGMLSGRTFGGLGGNAMTFTMGNSAQGFLWRSDVHNTTSNGAMSVTTDGKLTVASNTRIGYGISDTTPPSTNMLDVNGNIKINEVVGTLASPTTGSLVLSHDDAGGSSSIVFPSKNDNGSDYGYIQYQDHTSIGAGENSRLTIGLRNDNTDHIIIDPHLGNVGIGTFGTTAPIAKLDVNGNANITGNLTSTSLDVIKTDGDAIVNVTAPDSFRSILNLTGSGAQGTGRLFVGQNINSHGGGIEYNGDNNPISTDAGSDYLALYNTTVGWTARNPYNSPNWEFRGQVTATQFNGKLNGSVTSASQPAITAIGALSSLLFTSSASMTKISLYGASPNHMIGMDSVKTFGPLSEWAMTFTMNTTVGQGFLWRSVGHNDTQGAMALTTDGKLTVASNTRIGYGTGDATTPDTYMLDVGGDVNIMGTLNGLTEYNALSFYFTFNHAGNGRDPALLYIRELTNYDNLALLLPKLNRNKWFYFKTNVNATTVYKLLVTDTTVFFSGAHSGIYWAVVELEVVIGDASDVFWIGDGTSSESVVEWHIITSIEDKTKANVESPTFTGTVTAPTFVGDLNGSVIQASQTNITSLENLNTLSFTHSDAGEQIKLWGGSEYTIGTTRARKYGGLNDYAMRFTAHSNNNNFNGFLWRNVGHGSLSGAMSLTGEGKLTVASNTRIGYGEDDTQTPATYMLDVGGDVNIMGTLTVGSISGLTSASVGLSNVDNTSDLEKPLSDAQLFAIQETYTIYKIRLSGGHAQGITLYDTQDGQVLYKIWFDPLGNNQAIMKAFYTDYDLGIFNEPFDMSFFDDGTDPNRPRMILDPMDVVGTNGPSFKYISTNTPNYSALINKADIRSPTFTGTVTAPVFVGDFNGDVTQANQNSITNIGYQASLSTTNGGVISLWSGSESYSIRMVNYQMFGGLGSYAIINYMSDTSNRGWLWKDTSHSNSQGAMGVTTEGKLTVASNTRIGYGEGDTNDPGTSYMLDVNGDVKATSFIATSDKRVKINIQPIEPKTALEHINKLEPKTYKFYDNDNEKTHYGLIAQDVEIIIPEAVESNGTKFIPSIVEKCKLINNGKTIVLDMKTTSDILETKLEFDDLSGNKQQVVIESLEGEKYIHLKESIEQHSTETKYKRTIFVHGHEVSDFRSINYNTILVANIAATKELSKELNDTRRELNELKELVQTLIDR